MEEAMTKSVTKDMAGQRAHEFFIEEFLTLFATSMPKADGLKLLNILREDADKMLQSNLESGDESTEQRQLRIDLAHREYAHITRIIDFVNGRLTTEDPTKRMM